MTENNEEKFIPPYWHWAITCEQIKEIKNGNRTTINKVYFDNYEKFKRIVAKFCGDKKKYSYRLDCLQQCYVDLPLFNFTNCKTLYKSIVGCCLEVVYSTMRAISYDKQFDDDEHCFLDYIACCEMTSTDEYNSENKRVYDIITAQNQLTILQKDLLVSIAFGCEYRKGLYNELQKDIYSV